MSIVVKKDNFFLNGEMSEIRVRVRGSVNLDVLPIGIESKYFIDD